MPKVSVLIPTYNRAHMIGDAINSILGQTYKDFEIIVYDDGSTDNTSEVIKQFPSVKYIRSKENRGCAYARNMLADAASGEYACWQDSDDWSNAYRLELQVEAMKNAELVRTSAEDVRTTPRWTEKPRLIVGKLVVPKAATMFRMVDWVPVATTNSVGGSDRDWYVSMMRKCSECLLPQILYYMRKHRDRIGVWKNNRSTNPKWHDRMLLYKKGVK